MKVSEMRNMLSTIYVLWMTAPHVFAKRGSRRESSEVAFPPIFDLEKGNAPKSEKEQPSILRA